jgi:hypothetical protein
MWSLIVCLNHDGQVEWLVKFDGFDHRFNQWIPERDITDVSEENEQT